MNAPFVNLVYTIGDGPETYFAHDKFTVFTQPLDKHTLCGELIYTPYYKDQPILTDDPITYDESSRRFTVESSDDSLSNSIESYGVNVEFKDWSPSPINSAVSTATNGANVEFDNPCNNPTISTTI